jgi:hypothetical protein
MLEWQNEIILSNNVIAKRLIKVERVLSNQSQSENFLLTFSKYNNDIKKLFYINTSLTNFKLKIQQKIESELDQHSLNIKNFGWQQQQIVSDMNIEKIEFKIRFSGSLVDVISFMSKLEAQENLFDITGFNLDIQAQNKERLGRVSGSVKIAVYRSVELNSKIKGGNDE